MATDFTGAVDVRGYEGQYKVLPDGRVWSVRRAAPVPYSRTPNKTKTVGGKFLKPVHTAAGDVVSMTSPRRTVLIHTVVAKAFVPGYFKGAFVGFIDGNRNNYPSCNLEWITRAESQRRAVARPKKTARPRPPRRASGALDVWDSIPTGFGYSTPLPWE